MGAEEFVRQLWRDNPHLHLCSTETLGSLCSNRELKRWFEKGSVVINGVKVKAQDTLLFPITELVFHPNGKRKVTLVQEVE